MCVCVCVCVVDVCACTHTLNVKGVCKSGRWRGEGALKRKRGVLLLFFGYNCFLT